MFSALSSLSSDLQSLESALEESREKESEARKRSAEARATGAEEFHEAHDKWDEKAKRRRELFQQLNTFVEEDDEHSAMLEDAEVSAAEADAAGKNAQRWNELFRQATLDDLKTNHESDDEDKHKDAVDKEREELAARKAEAIARLRSLREKVTELASQLIELEKESEDVCAKNLKWQRAIAKTHMTLLSETSKLERIREAAEKEAKEAGRVLAATPENVILRAEVEAMRVEEAECGDVMDGWRKYSELLSAGEEEQLRECSVFAATLSNIQPRAPKTSDVAMQTDEPQEVFIE